MNVYLIRPVIAATLFASIGLMYNNARPARYRMNPRLPPGSIHLRAVRAFERHQMALRDSVVSLAEAQLGRPYIFGGSSPGGGFDCSGLVRWVFSQIHVVPPRTARQQARIGSPIQRELLRPGDLLTFGERDSVTHVGIYVGNGNFVHASSVAKKVIVSRVDRPPSDLIRPLAGARRVLRTVIAQEAISGS